MASQTIANNIISIGFDISNQPNLAYEIYIVSFKIGGFGTVTRMATYEKEIIMII